MSKHLINAVKCDRRDVFDNTNASDDPGCTITSIIPRGFTGHEMLDQLCLINMNARLYDPGLGQLLQADTVVPNPTSFAGYMRYSYTNNNPLNAIDPSGGENAHSRSPARFLSRPSTS